MSRLAFAIARQRPDPPPLGDIERTGYEGLAILHREAPVDAQSPGLESLQSFAKTIDALHARETILPLRFGSLHETDDDLQDVLRVRLDEWRAMLDEVDGCVEMGLRILLDAPPAASTAPTPLSSPLASTATAQKPGLAYLASRRARMAEGDAFRSETERVENVIVGAFEGLYRRRVVEGPRQGRENLLSLVFLVPRTNLDAFRQATGDLHDQGLGKILLTGPWPPYNFTQMECS